MEEMWEEGEDPVEYIPCACREETEGGGGSEERTIYIRDVCDPRLLVGKVPFSGEVN